MLLKRSNDWYYSLLLTPQSLKQKLLAILAYCQEVTAIRTKVSEPMVARVKLAWWRDETNRLFNQQAQHPVTVALSEIVKSFNLSRELFEEFLLAVEMDFEISRFPTFKECELFCARMAGAPAQLMAQVLGVADKKILENIRKIAVGYHLTALIQNLGQHLRAGRVYLPEQLLEQFGLNAHGLLHLQSSEALSNCLRSFATRAQEYLKENIEEKPFLIRAKLAQALLTEFEHDQFNVLHHKIDLTALRKCWIVFKNC